MRNIVVATKVDGVWQEKTYQEYYDDIIAAAKSLIEVCYNKLKHYVRDVEIVGIVNLNWPCNLSSYDIVCD